MNPIRIVLLCAGLAAFCGQSRDASALESVTLAEATPPLFARQMNHVGTYEADGVVYTVTMHSNTDRCGPDGLLVHWSGNDGSEDEGCMDPSGVDEFSDVTVRTYRGWALGTVWYIRGDMLLIGPDMADPEVQEDPDEQYDPIPVPLRILD